MTTASLAGETHRTPRLRGIALVAVLTGLMLTLFLEALDQTIAGAAMLRIIAEMHGLDRYSWVVTPYIEKGDRHDDPTIHDRCSAGRPG